MLNQPFNISARNSDRSNIIEGGLHILTNQSNSEMEMDCFLLLVLLSVNLVTCQQKTGKILFLFGNYHTQMEIIRSPSVRDSKTGSDGGGILKLHRKIVVCLYVGYEIVQPKVIQTLIIL